MLRAHGSFAFLQSPLKACLLQSALTILFSPFLGRKSSKALLWHKMMGIISIKLSGLPYLQGSRIRCAQQLGFLRLLKGSIVFLSSAFSANELHMSWMCTFLNLFIILEVILMSLYPPTMSCASFSRNLLRWSNAVSTE